MTDRLDVMERVITCENCELHGGCKAPVFMTGPSPANIAIVGEAPGKQEDEQGAPFVGPSGQLLREHLTAVGLDPETIAFINTVSCFPHGTPTWDHVHACAGNKETQLALANPTHVLAVGKVALKGFRPDLDISRGRGRPWSQDGRIMFATYHPAAALRNGNMEQAMHADLVTFVEMLEHEDWTKFISDSCTECAEPMWWLEECGLGWCFEHVPANDRSKADARRALLDRDLEHARHI